MTRLDWERARLHDQVTAAPRAFSYSNGAREATDKQRSYITSLAKRIGCAPPPVVTRAQAADTITRLKRRIATVERTDAARRTGT